MRRANSGACSTARVTNTRQPASGRLSCASPTPVTSRPVQPLRFPPAPDTKCHRLLLPASLPPDRPPPFPDRCFLRSPQKPFPIRRGDKTVHDNTAVFPAGISPQRNLATALQSAQEGPLRLYTVGRLGIVHHFQKLPYFFVIFPTLDANAPCPTAGMNCSGKNDSGNPFFPAQPMQTGRRQNDAICKSVSVQFSQAGSQVAPQRDDFYIGSQTRIWA